MTGADLDAHLPARDSGDAQLVLGSVHAPGTCQWGGLQLPSLHGSLKLPGC